MNLAARIRHKSGTQEVSILSPSTIISSVKWSFRIQKVARMTSAGRTQRVDAPCVSHQPLPGYEATISITYVSKFGCYTLPPRWYLLYGIIHVFQINLSSVVRHGISSIVSHKELYSWPSRFFKMNNSPPHPTPKGWGGELFMHHLNFVKGSVLGYPWARGVLVRILKRNSRSEFPGYPTWGVSPTGNPSNRLEPDE